MKKLVRHFVADKRGRAPVKHISGCSKRLGPVSQRHGSREEGAVGAVDGAKHTLSFAIC
jgi:hypothetical protein